MHSNANSYTNQHTHTHTHTIRFCNHPPANYLGIARDRVPRDAYAQVALTTNDLYAGRDTYFVYGQATLDDRGGATPDFFAWMTNVYGSNRRLNASLEWGEGFNGP